MYGIRLGERFFAGESMFHLKTGASKFALLAAVSVLSAQGVTWMDTQMVTPATAAFGAKQIPRKEYIARLRAAL